jgi:hypothetical protein
VSPELIDAVSRAVRECARSIDVKSSVRPQLRRRCVRKGDRTFEHRIEQVLEIDSLRWLLRTDLGRATELFAPLLAREYGHYVGYTLGTWSIGEAFTPEHVLTHAVHTVLEARLANADEQAALTTHIARLHQFLESPDVCVSILMTVENFECEASDPIPMVGRVVLRPLNEDELSLVHGGPLLPLMGAGRRLHGR